MSDATATITFTLYIRCVATNCGIIVSLYSNYPTVATTESVAERITLNNKTFEGENLRNLLGSLIM